MAYLHRAITTSRQDAVSLRQVDCHVHKRSMALELLESLARLETMYPRGVSEEELVTRAIYIMLCVHQPHSEVI